MVSEWIEVKLSTLCDITRGASPRPIHEWISKQGIPWVKISDASSAGSRYIERTRERIRPEGRVRSVSVFPGDLILSNSATPGIPMFMKIEACIHDGWLLLRNFRGLDKLFAYYLLLYERPALLQQGSGTVFTNLKTEILKNHKVRLPPPDEQRAIAHILGTLDDKIELNRQMNETLETMAQALFKSWFVDFDPVRAKAEGRDTGLSRHLADLFPDSFQDSDEGEIPKGWTIKSIEDVSERVGMGPFGSSIKVETFVPEGVPIISGQHLNGFMMEDNDFNFVTLEHADRLKSANVVRGDVIFTHAGNIGQVSYIPLNSKYERYVLSQRQFFMRCDLDQVTPIFIALYFKSPEGQHRLLANTSSSGVPSIARPVTYLRSIQLKLPTKQVLDAFDQLIQPMLIQFRSNQNESRVIATLRDILLPKLITGEIRVSSE
jgi:type I restriction enzyme S subunit